MCVETHLIFLYWKKYFVKTIFYDDGEFFSESPVIILSYRLWLRTVVGMSLENMFKSHFQLFENI